MRTIKSTDKDYTGEHYEGDFDCNDSKLESLEGAPKSVSGYFYCDNNDLKSLKGSPISVSGLFDCSDNKLESLEGAPKIIGGSFHCFYNKLDSLEGAPMSVGGYFYCDKNLYNGDNLYIIANALLNDRRGRPNFEKKALAALTEYFI